jgi:hypothetical protein
MTTTRSIVVFRGTRPAAVKLAAVVATPRVSAAERFSPEAAFEFSPSVTPDPRAARWEFWRHAGAVDAIFVGPDVRRFATSETPTRCVGRR